MEKLKWRRGNVFTQVMRGSWHSTGFWLFDRSKVKGTEREVVFIPFSDTTLASNLGQNTRLSCKCSRLVKGRGHKVRNVFPPIKYSRHARVAFRRKQSNSLWVAYRKLYHKTNFPTHESVSSAWLVLKSFNDTLFCLREYNEEIWWSVHWRVAVITKPETETITKH